MKHFLSLLAVAGGIALASPAMAAQFPASVIGGPWTWSANHSQVIVTISSQGSGDTCDQIIGTMQVPGTTNIADAQGYYCPATGRISLLRKDHASQATYQVWSGQIDATPTLSQAYVGGSFLSISTGYDAGEFSFSGAFTN